MKLRTKKAYVDVLSRIVEEEPLWKPCKLYACQEESLVSAINDSIPGCEIISSWFHLTQVCILYFIYLCLKKKSIKYTYI